jgi:hypothetical protein
MILSTLPGTIKVQVLLKSSQVATALFGCGSDIDAAHFKFLAGAKASTGTIF